MNEKDSLDELIKKYSESLMKVYRKSTPIKKEEAAVPAFAESVSMPEEEVVEEPEPKEELTGKSTFMASVHTGSGAFPVGGAKVIVGKEDSILSFLLTDENGETEKITLPAFEEKDSLSFETAKTVSYYADVFAEGFQEERNLPVEASGGAEIVLNVELTPTPERMN